MIPHLSAFLNLCLYELEEKWALMKMEGIILSKTLCALEHKVEQQREK